MNKKIEEIKDLVFSYEKESKWTFWFDVSEVSKDQEGCLKYDSYKASE